MDDDGDEVDRGGVLLLSVVRLGFVRPVVVVRRVVLV